MTRTESDDAQRDLELIRQYDARRKGKPDEPPKPKQREQRRCDLCKQMAYLDDHGLFGNHLNRWEKTCPGSGVEPHESLIEVTLNRASDIPERQLEWLWQARLLRGGIALLEGRPEQGKTMVICEIAARISRGQPLPNDSRSRLPENVVMLVAEDDVAATIIPRLRASGADLTKIHILEGTKVDGKPQPFHLTDDAAKLATHVRQQRAALVTIDPIVAYMGSRHGRSVDTNNDYATRQALLPLKTIAEETSAAVLAVRHYRKGRGIDAVEAGGGSVAFAAYARVLLAALEDPENDGGHLLAVAKNNNVPKSERPSVRYRIESWEKNPAVAQMVWGASVDLSASEVLRKLAERDVLHNGRLSAVDEAVAFLTTLFHSKKEIPATEVISLADDAGISEKTLKRAKQKAGLTSRQTDAGWVWERGETL